MTALRQDLAHRFASTQFLRQQRTHRFSNQFLQQLLTHRFRATNILQQMQTHRFRANPAKITSLTAMGNTLTFSTPVGEYDVAWQHNVGHLSVSLTVWKNGETKDLTGVPAILQITLNESAPAQWQLQILDDTGYYHPKKVGGEWEDWMNDKSGRKLLVNVSWGGASWQFVGIGKRYGHTRNSSDGRINFTWGGLGPTERLFRKARTEETLRSDSQAANPITNKDVIASTCDLYGQPYDLSRMEEAPVRVQHRQDGRPADWSQAAFETPTFAEWREEGETLVAFQPDYTGSQVHWTYNASTVVFEENLDSTIPDHVNTVDVRRASEAKTPPPGAGVGVGDENDNVVKVFDFGPQGPITFDPPMNGLMWRQLVQSNGIHSDFIARNKDGNVVGVYEVRGGTWPDFLLASGARNGIASIEWTYGAAPGFLGDGAYSEIEFFGSQGNAPGEVEDTVYTVTVSDDTSVADDGGEFRLELSPNPLLWDSEWMAVYGERYLYRKGRERDPITIRVPFNPLACLGDGVKIVDLILGTTEIRYVKQITHSIADDVGQLFTRFLLVKYPVLSISVT